MKYYLLLLLICFSSTILSQIKNHTFYLNDSTKVVYQNVKSKINKDYFIINHDDGSESKLYYKDFYRYEYDIKKCGVCKDYVREIKEFFYFKNYKVLAPVLVDGKCKLFSTYYGVGGYGGGIKYYIIRDDEIEPTQIGITGLISKNFKKVALEYFDDCEKMEAKINKRFKKKRKRLKEIVEFYNQNCN